MSEILALRRGHTSATLCPAIGGAMVSLAWRGIELLRPAPEGGTVRQMGMFTLLPYSNRIGHGRLPGEAPLRPNFPPEPHSVHGFGWQRAWQMAEAGTERARLTLAHQPDDDWPFACDAGLEVELLDDGAAFQLSLTNTDTRPMPAGLGFHPFFPLTQSVTLRACWDERWELDAERLPAHPIPASDFRAARAIGDWFVDHCFTGWNGRATLGYDSYSVHLEAGPETPFIVCFRPADGRPFIALEPVSHLSNAHQLQERGVRATGLRMLAPGATFSISMAIRATPNTRQP